MKVLKECFEKKDIGMLQEAVLKLSKEDAEYHIQRCVDSGLWVPNAKDAKDTEEGEGEEAGGTKDEEEVYEEVEEPKDKEK